MQVELRERLLEKPITIGVLGPMGSGKSTLSRILADKLGVDRVEENFPENPFLADFYGDPKEFSFRSQLWFLTSTVYQLMEIKDEKTRVFDPANEMNFLFAKTHHEIGWMSTPELEMYKSIYFILTENNKIKKPDLYLCVNAKLPVLIERIKKRGRPYEKLMLENYPYYLSALSAEVDSFKGANILHVDTSKDSAIDDTHIVNLMERIKRSI